MEKTQKRPSKRRRIATEGGSYHTYIPFSLDDYSDVHAREGRLIRVGPKTTTALPARTVQKSDAQWRSVTTWAPLDDPEFALDPDGDWYDEAVEASVMEDKVTPTIDLSKPRKKVRSKVSSFIDKATWMRCYVGKAEGTFVMRRDAQIALLAKRMHQDLLSTDVENALYLILPARPAVFIVIEFILYIGLRASIFLKTGRPHHPNPGLGIGWAYMVPREGYEAYVLSCASDEDISTCIGFQALKQANTQQTRGLRYTGVTGVFCGRSEMIMPNGIGNLQKGERYANMDYIFTSVVRFVALSIILISYDIACQWFINVFKRMERWPAELRIPSTMTLIPAILKLHEPMHTVANHQVYSLNYIPGVGQSDLETPEHVWSGHNAVGNATKSQGPGSRHDILNDHFAFWNWLKYTSLGETLLCKYRRAVADHNLQQEGHCGLMAALDKALVAEWEAICLAWENDRFPKSKKNPYKAEGASITEAEAKKELAAEEEKHLAAGGVSIHATSPPAFVAMTLELQDTQRRIKHLAKGLMTQATA
ncbi:hypothetical protein NLJ89_g9853 [Agrocybe chaxingu]|uniref:Uncharacterized protein n=1 Tax=Agrocybe chaxingu TaxID=84603 RepID=A0A9W8JST1_9AGAR|nr:hypothetical protein NLJ89_g9853 [Agrocybe chaxingu]